MSDRVSAVRADAFDHLKALREAREQFDVVILDPPAFVKRKKDFKEGNLAYRRINELGMRVLAPTWQRRERREKGLAPVREGLTTSDRLR